MIPSEEIEISLAFAETGHAVEFPARRAAELLRVYKAWAEAPEIVWPIGSGGKLTRGKFVETVRDE